MNYKKHTQDRFLERFANHSKEIWNRNLPNELTDEEYINLCNICKDPNNVLFQIKEKRKKLVYFYNVPMWCIMSRKKKIIKTIYPVSKKFMNKIKPKEIKPKEIKIIELPTND